MGRWRYFLHPCSGSWCPGLIWLTWKVRRLKRRTRVMYTPTSNHDEIRDWAGRHSALPAEIHPRNFDSAPAMLHFLFGSLSAAEPEIVAVDWEDLFAKFDLLGLRWPTTTHLLLSCSSPAQPRTRSGRSPRSACAQKTTLVSSPSVTDRPLHAPLCTLSMMRDLLESKELRLRGGIHGTGQACVCHLTARSPFHPDSLSTLMLLCPFSRSSIPRPRTPADP